MRAAREAFTPAGTALACLGAGSGGVVAFVLVLLRPFDGRAAAFAAAALGFLVAAVAGPFLWRAHPDDGRLDPALRAALRSLALGGCAAVACGAVAAARGGPLAGALCAGLVAGLYAYALAALGGLVRHDLLRVALALAGAALLATLHYWDDLVLLQAADRKASAALALRLNVAAAAAVTLDFDWIHAKALYAGNQTAESLVGVPFRGLGSSAIGLALIAALATLGAAWRRA